MSMIIIPNIKPPGESSHSGRHAIRKIEAIITDGIEQYNVTPQEKLDNEFVKKSPRSATQLTVSAKINGTRSNNTDRSFPRFPRKE